MEGGSHRFISKMDRYIRKNKVEFFELTVLIAHLRGKKPLSTSLI